MAAFDLETFVARSRAVVETDEPTTRDATRAWLVDPLLEELGWDVPGDCAAATTVAGAELDRVCAIDGVPALFVAVEPRIDSLERERAAALQAAMAQTGVDRAIYANGREFLLLAGASGEDRTGCRLAALPERESAVAEYARERVARRLDLEGEAAAARRLALERPSLVEALGTRLAEATDGRVAREAFEPAAERLLEDAIDELAVEKRPVHEERTRGDAATATDADRSSPESDDAETDSRRNGTQSGEKHAPGTPSSDEDDGEYVVRFFADRGSIGAIGHSTPERALVHAAEFCLERGLGDLEPPWRPDDDGPVVLDASPIGDGETSRRLSNGWHLEAGGTVADRAARVEALAARAGLRAMLTGDWESPSRE